MNAVPGRVVTHILLPAAMPSTGAEWAGRFNHHVPKLGREMAIVPAVNFPVYHGARSGSEIADIQKDKIRVLIFSFLSRKPQFGKCADITVVIHECLNASLRLNFIPYWKIRQLFMRGDPKNASKWSVHMPRNRDANAPETV